MTVRSTNQISIDELQGSAVGADLTATAESVIVADIAIPNATDTLVNVAFPFNTLKAIWLSSDQNLTVETNSSSAPTQTITLTAGVPYQWITGNGAANPISADVTKLYVTSAAVATLKIRVAFDPTP